MIGFENLGDSSVEIIEVKLVWHFFVTARNYFEIGMDQFEALYHTESFIKTSFREEKHDKIV